VVDVAELEVFELEVVALELELELDEELDEPEHPPTTSPTDRTTATNLVLFIA